MGLSNLCVNVFGLEIPELWVAIAALILGAILLTVVIIICASSSKKAKAEKAAAQKAAEEKAEEEQRVKEEAEAAEKKAQEEAAKKAEEEAAAKAAEEEKAKAEEEAKVAAEEEAKKAEEAEAKKKAAAEKRKQTLAAKKAAEEQAKKEAEEKAAAEAEEAARVAAEEEAKKAEEEAAAKKAEEEAAAKKAEEEAAAKKAEEAEAKKKAAAEKRKQTLAAKKAAAAQVVDTPVEEKKEEAPAEEVVETPVEEVKAEETPAPKKTEEKPAAKAPRYSGKWVVSKVTIENEEDEHYLFELFASNGQLLLTSWEYNSHQGALRGMETYKANIEKGNFRIYETKKGEFFFKLLTAKNTLLGTGANYPTKELCEKAVESVKRFAATAVLDEKVREVVLKASEEDDFTETVEQVGEDYVGKWVISVDKKEDGKEIYTFELFANNGQLLLSSEEYTSYVGVINGIATHKASIQKGLFSIQLTKKKEYFFLLLNGNKQPLCLGEHYKSKARCESAVESVKRFAQNALIFFDGKEVK